MKVTTREGKVYLKLDGDLTVSQATDLKNALLDSITRADNIEVNLSEVNLIDIACLQILCSAHLTADKEGKRLSVKKPMPSPYLLARKNAGFIYNKPCGLVSADDCLWVEGEE